jgi:hypothetical protein
MDYISGNPVDQNINPFHDLMSSTYPQDIHTCAQLYFRKGSYVEGNILSTGLTLLIHRKLWISS